MAFWTDKRFLAFLVAELILHSVAFPDQMLHRRWIKGLGCGRGEVLQPGNISVL